jgi:hypothetical protein
MVCVHLACRCMCLPPCMLQVAGCSHMHTPTVLLEAAMSASLGYRAAARRLSAINGSQPVWGAPPWYHKKINGGTRRLGNVSAHQAIDLCIEPVLLTQLQCCKSKGCSVQIAHHHQRNKPAPICVTAQHKRRDDRAEMCMPVMTKGQPRKTIGRRTRMDFAVSPYMSKHCAPSRSMSLLQKVCTWTPWHAELLLGIRCPTKQPQQASAVAC